MTPQRALKRARKRLRKAFRMPLRREADFDRRNSLIGTSFDRVRAAKFQGYRTGAFTQCTPITKRDAQNWRNK